MAPFDYVITLLRGSLMREVTALGFLNTRLTAACILTSLYVKLSDMALTPGGPSASKLKLSAECLCLSKAWLVEAGPIKLLDLTSSSIFILSWLMVDLEKFLYRKPFSRRAAGETGISRQKWMKAPWRPRFLMAPLHFDGSPPPPPPDVLPSLQI